MEYPKRSRHDCKINILDIRGSPTCLTIKMYEHQCSHTVTYQAHQPVILLRCEPQSSHGDISGSPPCQNVVVIRNKGHTTLFNKCMMRNNDHTAC